LFLVSHAVALRRGLAVLLDADPRFAVVGEGNSAAEARARVPAVTPDLVVVSRRLPDGTGFDLTRELRSARPGQRVLILSVEVDDVMSAEALDAGAAGLVTAFIDERDLSDALVRAACGETLVAADVVRRLLEANRRSAPDPLISLTPLERELFELVGEGLTNPEIADRLRLSHGTVRNYVSRMMHKLGMERRAQVVALATRTTDAAGA
jgi:two-component system response regulator DevR